MNLVKRSALVIFMIILVSFGASLTLKAAVGVGAWDAISQSMSLLTGIKVGTFAMFLNGSCVIGQLIVLHKNFNISRILQIGVAILLGVFVNFFYYNLLSSINLDSYIVRLITFILAMIILSFAVAAVMVINVVTFPLEALCMVVSDKTGLNFAKLRQGVDVFAIVYSLAITFFFAQALVVREGTIIGMLLFGPLLGFFMHHLEPTFTKLNLTK